MVLESYLTSNTTINSKWINNLNVRSKTTELLEDNIEVILDDLIIGNGFLDLTTKAQATKEK